MPAALDFDKFAKVVSLTSSDQDGEALAALRAANRMLKLAGLVWRDVLKAPQAQAAPGPKHQPTQGNPFDDMMDAMKYAYREHDRDFRRHSYADWTTEPKGPGPSSQYEGRSTPHLVDMLVEICRHHEAQGRHMTMWHLMGNHFKINGYFSPSTEKQIEAEYQRLRKPKRTVHEW